MIGSLFATFSVATVSGLLAGVFGIGGSIFLVPFMNWLLSQSDFSQLQNPLVVVSGLTSFVCVFFISVLNLWRRRQNLDAMSRDFAYLWIPTAVGVPVGLMLHEYWYAWVQSQGLAWFFLLLACHKLTEKSQGPKDNLYSVVEISAYVFLMSVLSSVVGLTSGIFLFPFFLSCSYSKEHSAILVSYITLITAAIQLCYRAMYLQVVFDSVWVFSGVFWPMLCAVIVFGTCSNVYGIRMNRYFEDQVLQWLLGGVLLVLSLSVSKGHVFYLAPVVLGITYVIRWIVYDWVILCAQRILQSRVFNLLGKA